MLLPTLLRGRRSARACLCALSVALVWTASFGGASGANPSTGETCSSLGIGAAVLLERPLPDFHLFPDAQELGQPAQTASVLFSAGHGGGGRSPAPSDGSGREKLPEAGTSPASLCSAATSHHVRAGKADLPPPLS